MLRVPTWWSCWLCCSLAGLVAPPCACVRTCVREPRYIPTPLRRLANTQTISCPTFLSLLPSLIHFFLPQDICYPSFSPPLLFLFVSSIRCLSHPSFLVESPSGPCNSLLISSPLLAPHFPSSLLPSASSAPPSPPPHCLFLPPCHSLPFTYSNLPFYPLPPLPSPSLNPPASRRTTTRSVINPHTGDTRLGLPPQCLHHPR